MEKLETIEVNLKIDELLRIAAGNNYESWDNYFQDKNVVKKHLLENLMQWRTLCEMMSTKNQKYLWSLTDSNGTEQLIHCSWSDLLKKLESDKVYVSIIRKTGG